MCFSAAASFTVGGALLPAGAYCIKQALRKNRSFLALAAIPIFFGVQQITEGFVWMGLNGGDKNFTTKASLFYLFFAIPFWPFWIPFSTMLAENERVRKRIMGLIVILSLVWGAVVYSPILLDPQRWLTVQIVHHSIQYVYNELPLFQYFSREWVQITYVMLVAAPLVIASGKKSVPFFVLMVTLAAISKLFFAYAFISVWCFFASFIAFFLCVMFYRMKPGE
ncbi:MAG: hypothetical protein K8T89_15595 [Planctomycetes bacterium]|nr:hypothetical protein [Planctomycetota bacterium]